MVKTVKKEIVKPKSLKEQKKELEGRLFGEKNKVKKKEIQGLIKKLDLAMDLENKQRVEQENIKKNTIVQQLIPVGVDPKTVQCINFLNKNCDKGDDCQFAHDIKKEVKKEIIEDVGNKQKVVCRFLIDAINNGEYTKNWVCPLPNCKDIHRLLELSENSEVEVTLEEYIELQRQNVDEVNLTPVTETNFLEWKAKKDKEEEMHAKRVAALSSNVKGVDLFKICPDMFEDDEEAAEDVNYAERNYEDSETEELETE